MPDALHDLFAEELKSALDKIDELTYKLDECKRRYMDLKSERDEWKADSMFRRKTTQNRIMNLKRERDDFHNKTVKLREALADVLDDIAEYERVNNLAVNPGRSACWQSVERARAVLEEE
jgi:uncharacterized coiled-coil DUF342 family protein